MPLPYSCSLTDRTEQDIVCGISTEEPRSQHDRDNKKQSYQSDSQPGQSVLSV